MKIENIKDFIEDFIRSEYKCGYAKWDIDVSNEDYEKYKNKAYGFMHTNSSNPSGRAGVLEDLLTNSEKRSLALIKLKKIIPRILFQLKHYETPTLGDALKRIVTGNDLYACYVSYDLNVGRNPFFSSIFYVSETNQGLKIIYRKLFDDEKGKWYHSHDLEAAQIINSGKLIEVQKYIAPEEATSLADYNAE